MGKTKNKISTTRTTGFLAFAAVSLISAGNTTSAPQIILSAPIGQEIILKFQPNQTSTRFNNASRYSLDKLRSNKKILQSLGNLKSNWNGYGGEPIDPEVVGIAEHIITELDYQPQIFPTGRGTIQIEYFKNDNNLIEVEISKDELFVYRVEEGEDFESTVEVDELSELIIAFYA